MKYISTRGSNQTKTSAQAIIKGIAEDKGLYVPVNIPKLEKDPAELVGMNYREVAFLVLSKFLTDYSEEELRYCIDHAYDSKFEAEEVVPVVKAGDAWFLELYHGRTAAFKDMALSILPYLLTTAMKKEKEDKKIAILTATSGDTGKAALEGFANVPNTEIIVFFPRHGVSQVQAMQMVTQEEPTPMSTPLKAILTMRRLPLKISSTTGSWRKNWQRTATSFLRQTPSTSADWYPRWLITCGLT